MPAWAGKIYQKAQQNVLSPSKETKKSKTPLNVLLKTGYPPSPKKKDMYVRTKIQNAS